MPGPKGAAKRLAADGRRLWSLGWTDPMIAAKLCCVKSLVCVWRKRHRLPANAPTGSEDWRVSLVQRVEKASETIKAHELGLTDAEMAVALGITMTAAQHRRLRLGLRPNKNKPALQQRQRGGGDMLPYSRAEDVHRREQRLRRR